MDEEYIQRTVEEFISRLRQELESLVQHVRTSAETALEEMSAFGLTEHDSSGLFLELVDFGGIIERSREASLKLCDDFLEELEEMDPEEEQEIRWRIMERIMIFMDEFGKKMMEG
ncbi:MAG: hypothetical protein Q8R40_07010 [bacterium]|nr:hypothetical protein [bacterium]